MGTNKEMGHTQKEDTYGRGTHIEWRSGDTYGDGIHTERGHTRRGTYKNVEE